ncbi:hypothetical protein DMENIID0001_026450 [Sergentomyia squamirostris]
MKSDDTEVLLLIPPDFFLVNEPEIFAADLNSSSESSMFEGGFANNSAPRSMDRNSYNTSFLKEIDSFLQERHPDDSQKLHSVINLSDISMRDLQPMSGGTDIHEKAVIALQRHSELMGKQKSQVDSMNNDHNPRKSLSFSTDPPLISLNDLWSCQGKAKEAASLQEERMRREHCEKSIHLLQARILEYQQKLAVAMEVDRTKDDIISKLQSNVKSLENQNMNLRTELREKTGEIERRNIFLEGELAKTVGKLTDLQDRNEVFHAKIIHLTKANEDVKEITKRQMEDLQVRLSNSLKVEQILNDDLVKAKKLLEEEKEKIKSMENNVQEAKARSEEVVKEKSSLQTAFDLLNEKLKNLSDEHQSQQSYLKSYYQDQLNGVVKQKIKEFQQQLDAAEAEAHNLSRLCQKHEQEISLLTEKHSEELSLSHFQLVVATKTIDELREKLTGYENRRMDIAQRLHGVMEVQWQKALEILSSPSSENTHQPHAKRNLREDFLMQCRESPRRVEKKTNDEEFQDKMQAYMKILLKKSLSEFASTEPTKENPANDKSPPKMRNKHRPWR